MAFRWWNLCGQFYKDFREARDFSSQKTRTKKQTEWQVALEDHNVMGRGNIFVRVRDDRGSKFPKVQTLGGRLQVKITQRLQEKSDQKPPTSTIPQAFTIPLLLSAVTSWIYSGQICSVTDLTESLGHLSSVFQTQGLWMRSSKKVIYQEVLSTNNDLKLKDR